jgi:HD-GYP domain-containing protein (c-di-GMP phosphodiesterase class II)
MSAAAAPPLDLAQRRDAIADLDAVADVIASFSQAPSVVLRPHPLLVAVRREEWLVLVAPAAVWDKGRHVLRPYLDRLADGRAALVLVGSPRERDLPEAIRRGVASVLPEGATPVSLEVAIGNAIELIEARARAESRGRWLDRYRFELGELIEIAKAISTEREIRKLLDLILEKSRFITGADAGSIYVVEGDDPDPTRRMLRFKLSHNDSVAFDSREFTMPIGVRSMAGYVALHRGPLNIADVYDLPPMSPYGFDRSFDQKIGYRTKSMLCAPLIARGGDIVGVIQLINKKKDPQQKLVAPADFESNVVAFDQRSEELLLTLASQAGIALENAVLYDEIRTMLEGFVHASVEAIEQRDPTTSGHSRRVAGLTVGLARAVERETEGPYKGVAWTADDLRELEYASLLHDFGKIGVREEVLVKAKKLYPHELDRMRARFDYVERTLEVEHLQRKIRVMERGGSEGELRALDDELAARRAELESAFAAVLAANEPTVLKGGDFAKIESVARETYVDLAGCQHALITPGEVASLSVTRGSLTTAEIEEIRSHVTHTFEFLSQVPWGKKFRRIASIAGSHHERLNGTGYPHRLRAEEIPLQSKMMSIADIFDALTASDRPYKKAVPLDRALEILDFEVKDQHVDASLVRTFREARVWESVDLAKR